MDEDVWEGSTGVVWSLVGRTGISGSWICEMDMVHQVDWGRIHERNPFWKRWPQPLPVIALSIFPSETTSRRPFALHILPTPLKLPNHILLQF